jgi:hypothetical protein
MTGVSCYAGCPFASRGEPEASEDSWAEIRPIRSLYEYAEELGECPHHQLVEESSKMTASISPDEGQMTFGGCKCKSSCGATGLQARCDWCDTADGCGKGIFTKYGYCDYSNVGYQNSDSYTSLKDFEAQSFEDKTEYFWNKITANTQTQPFPSLTKILLESVITSFDNLRDEMPAGRQKHIHGVGSICQFDFRVTESSPYTGLLAPGLTQGIIRMGSAVDPVSNDGLTPGLGIKFLRSGVHSGNYVALHSLDFGQTWNFFGVNVSNHIPPQGNLQQTLLVKKFNDASQCPPRVGLSDLTAYSQDGSPASSPKTPYKLFHVPSAAVQTPDTAKTVDQVNGEMAQFPVGTVLYHVYACGAPAGEAEMTPTVGGVERACAEPIKLGDYVTTTKCTSSDYGDKKFFIRHQRVEDDWKQNPHFIDSLTAKSCGWGGSIRADGAPAKCTAA